MDITIINSPESERELLSYVLVHNSLDIAEKYEIQEEDFSVLDYKALFKVFKTLNNQGKRIDLLEVSNFLTTNSVKLVAEPKALIASILDSAYYNPESAASIVKDKSLRRRIMSAAEFAKKESNNLLVEPQDLLASMQEELLKVERQVHGDRYQLYSANKLAVSVFDYLTSEHQKLPNLGWYSLDNILEGIRPCVYLVAGGTGMGKTSFMLAMAMQLMKLHGLPALYFTPEMTQEQFATRMLSNITGINSSDLLQIGRNEQHHKWDTMSQGIVQLGELPLYVNDNSSPSMAIIESDIRKVIAQRGERMAVFVDYLQQLPPVSKDGDSASELGRRMQLLDNISKRYQVPLFVGCQINRSNATTQDKRPDLFSIRGSGEIAEKAAVILGLFRSAYYSKDPGDYSFEVSVLKNRWGRMGETAYLRCDLGTSSFWDATV